MGFSTSATPNNRSNVPASHGQMGYGTRPGQQGNRQSYLGRQINPGKGGTVATGANWQDPNSLPEGFGGYTDWYNLTHGIPVKNHRGDAISANRKGSQWEPIRNIYIDDPHYNGW